MRIKTQFTYLFSSTKAAIFLILCCLSLHGFGIHFERKENSKSMVKSINFVQNQIDVTHFNETIYFSLRVCSNETLSKAIVFLKSPSGNELLQTTCLNNKNTKQAFFLGQILFKKKSESGIWNITKIIIEDTSGQQVTYDKSYLSQQNLSYSVQIINRSAK